MSEAVGPEPVAAPPIRSPERQGPFGPIAAGARVTYVWATPLAQIAMHVIAVVPAFLVTLVALVPIAIATGATSSPEAAMTEDLTIVGVAIAAAIQFPVWALFAILWVRGFERRSLASAGFRGPFALRNYGLGLAVGSASALVLTVLVVLFDPGAAGDPVAFDPGRLLRPDWVLTIVGVIVFFLVQGSCEEIAFRGWMMSAIAARRGLTVAVAVSTATFGLMHVLQYLASGALAAVTALLAVTCVGLFLALWAIKERSLAGVCGIHGAFNATGVILGMIAAAAGDPEAGPWEVLSDTISEATGLEGEVSSGGAAVQFFLFAVLCAVAWRWLGARRAEFR